MLIVCPERLYWTYPSVPVWRNILQAFAPTALLPENLPVFRRRSNTVELFLQLCREDTLYTVWSACVLVAEQTLIIVPTKPYRGVVTAYRQRNLRTPYPRHLPIALGVYAALTCPPRASTPALSADALDLLGPPGIARVLDADDGAYLSTALRAALLRPPPRLPRSPPTIPGLLP